MTAAPDLPRLIEPTDSRRVADSHEVAEADRRSLSEKAGLVTG